MSDSELSAVEDTTSDDTSDDTEPLNSGASPAVWWEGVGPRPPAVVLDRIEGVVQRAVLGRLRGNLVPCFSFLESKGNTRLDEEALCLRVRRDGKLTRVSIKPRPSAMHKCNPRSIARPVSPR